MTATVQAMTAVARQHPAGRAALALIWLGLLIGTAGIWQLQQELSRRPLDGRRVVCWACAAGRHYWCTGRCDCCGGAVRAARRLMPRGERRDDAADAAAPTAAETHPYPLTSPPVRTRGRRRSGRGSGGRPLGAGPTPPKT